MWSTVSFLSVADQLCLPPSRAVLWPRRLLLLHHALGPSLMHLLLPAIPFSLSLDGRTLDLHVSALM